MAIDLCSSLLAGFFCFAAPPGSIPVKLSGFDDCYAGRQADGTYQVRWNRDEYPWIRNSARCRELWVTRRASDDPEWEGLTLAREEPTESEESSETDEPLIVKTCAQWFAAVQQGGYARTSYDMSNESHLVHLDGILSSIALARPAIQSAFTDFDLQSIARELLPPSAGRGEIEWEDDPECHWSIQGNTIRRRDECDFESITPVALGDIDGDGWEDFMAMSGGGATHGTLYVPGFRALTRRGNGPLLDISCRLPDGMPSPLEREREIAQWRANFNLPVDREVELTGSCKCDLKDHGLSMKLSASAGLLEGSYRCDRHPRWLPLKGCLAKSTGSMSEFGIDKVQTGTLYFNWRLVSGVLSIEGWRCGNSFIGEALDFTAEGAVAAPGERMIEEDCSSEVRFSIGSTTMSLRRECKSDIIGNRKAVLCVGSGDSAVELIRMDTIEATAESGEDDQMKFSHSLHRVDRDCTMAIFRASARAESRGVVPSLIAIPLREGRVSAHEMRVFEGATIVTSCGDTRIAAGAVVWQWAGSGWVEKKGSLFE